MIDVLLAEDNNDLAAALQLFIEMEPDMRVVERAQYARDIMDLVDKSKPDLVLLDLWFPDGESIGLIPQISTIAPETKVVVLSVHDSPVLLRAARDAGAIDYLVKGMDNEDMLRRIRHCCSSLAGQK
ncbi:MAG: response regulator transcription factor [Tepidisphaeraceae bacterium]